MTTSATLSPNSVVMSYYKDNDVELSLELVWPVAYIHLSVERFSKTVAIKLMDCMDQLEADLKQLNYEAVLCYNPAQTKEWMKLVIKLTGYPIHYTMDNGHIVFGKDLRCPQQSL